MRGNMERGDAARSTSDIVNTPVDTARLGKSYYNIELLKQYAEELPVTRWSLDNFNDYFEPDYYCWRDKEGTRISPYQIISNWEAAQHNPLWQYHVSSIQNANLEEPIWFKADEGVFDGVHRICRALLEHLPTVPVRVWESIPDIAKLYEKVDENE